MSRVDSDPEDMWRLKVGSFSPSFLAAVVQLQLDRVDRGVRAHVDRRTHPERTDPFDGFGASMTNNFGPLEADAFFLLITIDRLRRLCRSYERMLGPQEVR